jgi:Tol biopolymer transport system component
MRINLKLFLGAILITLLVLFISFMLLPNQHEKNAKNAPDGKKYVLYFTGTLGNNSKYSIFSRDLKNDTIYNLTEAFSYANQSSISPDRKKIVFTGSTNGVQQIWSMNIDGTDQQQLTFDQSPTGANSPTWSLDGKEIAYISNPDTQNSTIYIMNSDGSNRELISTGFLWARELAWSPVDDTLAVSMELEKNRIGKYIPSEIYLVNLTGTIVNELTEVDSLYDMRYHPNWSPDGQLIVYESIEKNCVGIKVISSKGGESRCLYQNEKKIGDTIPLSRTPSFSPDGTKIYFSSNKDGDYDIYSISIDGKDVQKITNLEGDELSPVMVEIEEKDVQIPN